MSEIKRLIEKRKKKMKDLREVKLKLEDERKKRAGDEKGIEHLLFDILEKHQIKRQSFHGGAMNDPNPIRSSTTKTSKEHFVQT